MSNTRLNRRDFLISAGSASLTAAWAPSLLAQDLNRQPVRVAVIGVGSRGTGLLKILLKFPGTVVPAICDIDESHLNRAIQIVEKTHGNTPAGFSRGPYDYRRMLERDDFDAVLIAAPEQWHTVMSVDAMNAGKHVGCEVIGALSLDECWSLVKTKENTKKRYMLLENYIYSRDRMMAYNMARSGAFGEMHYAECSYIHDCRNLRFEADGSLTWRGEIKAEHFGCLYPSHPLGPVCKWLGIHQGDRLVSLTSQMSKPVVLHKYAVEKFGPDSKAAQVKFQAGDMCVTPIKTAQGRLITVFYDSDSPRPLSIFSLVQGLKGVYDSRSGIYLEGKSPAHQWEPVEKYREKYEHPYWRDHGEEAQKSGHGGGDYFVVSDFVDMVRNDKESLVNVYDSAAWSSIMPLSAESIRRGGDAVEIPDFTGGKWKQGL